MQSTLLAICVCSFAFPDIIYAHTNDVIIIVIERNWRFQDTESRLFIISSMEIEHEFLETLTRRQCFFFFFIPTETRALMNFVYE